MRWDATWSPKWNSTLGATILSIQNAHFLTNGVVPNIQRGNPRNADGTLAFAFNPWVIDGGITYNLDSFPFYKDAFPIRPAASKCRTGRVRAPTITRGTRASCSASRA